MPEKAVGKSSGWKGPTEEYEKNKGSVGRKRIVFIGASYKFVHKVLRDMLLVGGFEEVELVVHDQREEPLKIVGDLLERIARQKKTKIVVKRTMNLDEALKGADAAVLSISTGGMEADMRSFEVCFKYGIPVGVGDTMGPPALARNLRCLPIVVDLVRKMDKICPNAVMLNFTNPMSVITGGMGRFSGILTWGLCHSADELFRYFSTVFNCKKSEVKMEVGGVNHQTFVSKLMIKGKDRTKDMLKAVEASDAKLEDNLLETRKEEVLLQKDIFRVLGAWPSCGESHAAEFYKYFFTDRSLDRHNMRHELKRVIPGRERMAWHTPHPIIMDWTYGPEPVGDLHLLTTEHAHELLWAAFTGEPFTRILNLVNAGEYIQGLPKTACVEALVTIAGKKVTGSKITLPPVIHGLVTQWTTIHELSIQAAMNCDRQAALQALFLDPHTKEFYDLEPMLDDILESTKEWLPKGWFKD